MKALNKFLIISFFIFSIPSISFALPKCVKTFHNCTGSYTYKSGNKYIGDWQNSKRHGFGTYLWKNGDKFSGYWVNDKMAGEGRYTFASGEKYIGYFLNNKRHGKGTYTYNNGNKYVGDWVNDKQNGKGIFTFANGKKQEGVFKNNKFLYAEKLDKKTHSSTSSEWGKSSLCRMLKRLAEKDSTKYDWQLGIGSAKRFLNQYPNSDVKDCLAKAIKILASKDFTPKPKFVVLDSKEYNSSKDIGWNRKYNNPQQNEKLKISLPAMKFLATNEKISLGAFNRNFFNKYSKYAGLENPIPMSFQSKV
jgi:hypothetical protein